MALIQWWWISLFFLLLLSFTFAEKENEQILIEEGLILSGENPSQNILPPESPPKVESLKNEDDETSKFLTNFRKKRQIEDELESEEETEETALPENVTIEPYYSSQTFQTPTGSTEEFDTVWNLASASDSSNSTAQTIFEKLGASDNTNLLPVETIEVLKDDFLQTTAASINEEEEEAKENEEDDGSGEKPIEDSGEYIDPNLLFPQSNPDEFVVDGNGAPITIPYSPPTRISTTPIYPSLTEILSTTASSTASTTFETPSTIESTKTDITSSTTSSTSESLERTESTQSSTSSTISETSTNTAKATITKATTTIVDKKAERGDLPETTPSPLLPVTTEAEVQMSSTTLSATNSGAIKEVFEEPSTENRTLLIDLTTTKAIEATTTTTAPPTTENIEVSFIDNSTTATTSPTDKILSTERTDEALTTTTTTSEVTSGAETTASKTTTSTLSATNSGAIKEVFEEPSSENRTLLIDLTTTPTTKDFTIENVEEPFREKRPISVIENSTTITTSATDKILSTESTDEGMTTSQINTTNDALTKTTTSEVTTGAETTTSKTQSTTSTLTATESLPENVVTTMHPSINTIIDEIATTPLLTVTNIPTSTTIKTSQTSSSEDTVTTMEATEASTTQTDSTIAVHSSTPSTDKVVTTSETFLTNETTTSEELSTTTSTTNLPPSESAAIKTTENVLSLKATEHPVDKIPTTVTPFQKTTTLESLPKTTTLSTTDTVTDTIASSSTISENTPITVTSDEQNITDSSIGDNLLPFSTTTSSHFDDTTDHPLSAASESTASLVVDSSTATKTLLSSSTTTSIVDNSTATTVDFENASTTSSSFEGTPTISSVTDLSSTSSTDSVTAITTSADEEEKFFQQTIGVEVLLATPKPVYAKTSTSTLSQTTLESMDDNTTATMVSTSSTSTTSTTPSTTSPSTSSSPSTKSSVVTDGNTITEVRTTESFETPRYVKKEDTTKTSSSPTVTLTTTSTPETNENHTSGYESSTILVTETSQSTTVVSDYNDTTIITTDETIENFSSPTTVVSQTLPFTTSETSDTLSSTITSSFPPKTTTKLGTIGTSTTPLSSSTISKMGDEASGFDEGFDSTTRSSTQFPTTTTEEDNRVGDDDDERGQQHAGIGIQPPTTPQPYYNSQPRNELESTTLRPEFVRGPKGDKGDPGPPGVCPSDCAGFYSVAPSSQQQQNQYSRLSDEDIERIAKHPSLRDNRRDNQRSTALPEYDTRIHKHSSTKGEKGERGERGPPGPPGQPGTSYAPSSHHSSSSSSGSGSGGIVSVYQTSTELFASHRSTPIGQLAFSISAQELYIRVNNGWAKVKLEGFYPSVEQRAPVTASVDEYQPPPSPATQTYEPEIRTIAPPRRIEPPPRESSQDDQRLRHQQQLQLQQQQQRDQQLREQQQQREQQLREREREREHGYPYHQKPLSHANPQDKVLHLIALNAPVNGRMAGIRGADLQCYQHARKSGYRTTFRAFLSSNVQDLRDLVHYADNDTIVVNSRGEKLFDTWSHIFNPTIAPKINVPIYSFNQKNIFDDNQQWQDRYIWHGSDETGRRLEQNFCEFWRTNDQYAHGMASAVQSGRPLITDAEPISCHRHLIVLCVENMSKYNVDLRLGQRKQRYKF